MPKKELSPTARNLMVREVLEQKQPLAQVAKRYNISRVTLYKWIKRAKEEEIKRGERLLLNKERVVEKYWRQTPEKYEDAILSLIRHHPEWGIRTLVKNLPRIGNLPIVGHHGVQNVLRRNNLLTYDKRLEYVKAQKTPLVKFAASILDTINGYLDLPFAVRQSTFRFFLTFLVSFAVTVTLTGVYSYSVRPYDPLDNRLGMAFATIALSCGFLLFIYSLKYYLSLAIVLSYTHEDGEKPVRRRSKWMEALLGSVPVAKESLGLYPDLGSISLKDQPFVSVHIPFYNEKYVVDRSIHASLSFDYPNYEVILCDDSTDETTDIIRSRMERYLYEGENIKVTRGDGWTLSQVEIKPGVVLKHLHRTNREGFKGGALSVALSLCNPRTEKVVVFDADFVPYPDTLALFLKYFQGADENVAVVQGYQWHVLNKSENWVTRGVRSEYAGSYVIERAGIEIYGGLKQISGSVYMIRKDVLEKIGWGSSITEDFQLTLKLYQAGYKVAYTPYIQTPAECASTLQRLIRQRMRWAEGHSANVRKMFWPLLFSSRLTLAEKAEFIYLAPYYLQTLFFLVGTFSWLVSETLFKTRLPFWTEVWGWSLILTNIIALPLLNAVGLFLEESEERDYMGLGSFLALSYILAPFQAYAAVKGFLEKEEGTWFRTPKTGKITDVFTRGRFYRFLQGFLPGTAVVKQTGPSPYLALTTANNRFGSFKIKTGSRWVAKLVLVLLLTVTVTVYSVSRGVPEVLATNPATTQYLTNDTTTTLTGAWKLLSSVDTQDTTTKVSLARNQDAGSLLYDPGTTNSTDGTKCSSPTGNGFVLDTPFEGSGGNIAAGTWSFYVYESDDGANRTAHLDVCVYKITVAGSTINTSTNLYNSDNDGSWPTTDIMNGGVTSATYTTSSQSQFDFAAGEYVYIEYWLHNTTKVNEAAKTSTFYTGECGATDPQLTMPTITIPENSIYFIVLAPFIPFLAMYIRRKDGQPRLSL